MSKYPTIRTRRVRRTRRLRRLLAETHPHPGQLVLPLFVVNGTRIRHPIEALPGHHRLSVDEAVRVAKEAEAAGLGGVMLFGIPDRKDAEGNAAADTDGPVARGLEAIASAAPQLVRWADVCLCQYTSHGHCGILWDGRVENDATLPHLARAATTYADAGADIIAPSDMLDGRIGRIRQALDDAGHHELAICSYAVKYASALYGPFQDAAGSAPAFGNRQSHQMDPPNGREARRQVDLDLAEGADLVMVKPATFYLDVIHDLRARIDVAIAAYQVSGEYASIEAAAARGWVDRNAMIVESLTSIVRSGADVVLTYFALDAARLLVDR